MSMTNRIRLSPPGTGAIHAMYPPLVASSGPIKARSRHGRSRRKAYGRRGPAPPRGAAPRAATHLDCSAVSVRGSSGGGAFEVLDHCSSTGSLFYVLIYHVNSTVRCRSYVLRCGP